MLNITELGNSLIAVSNFEKFAVKQINEETLEVTDIPVFNSKDIVVPGGKCAPAIYATEYQDKVLCYYQEDGYSWEVRVFAKLMCKNFYQAIFMDFEGKNLEDRILSGRSLSPGTIRQICSCPVIFFSPTLSKVPRKIPCFFVTEI